MIRDRLDAVTAVVQLPIGAESEFRGVIDLVEMKAIVWPLDDDTEGAKFEVVDIPAEFADAGRRRRAASCSRRSRTSTTRCWRSTSPTRRSPPPRSSTRSALGTLEFEFVPVLCGSAFKNKGVQPMLDAVVDYLPSPLDLPPTAGHRPEGRRRRSSARRARTSRSRRSRSRSSPTPTASSPTSASTRASSRRAPRSTTRPRTARSASAASCACTPNQREDIDVAYAGDIVAGLGFKQTTTGDTLCERAHPIVLERMEFPEPVISVAIEPKTKDDQDKLGKALGSLSDEDPTFLVHTDDDTGQTIIAGMGELHLEVLVDRMMREFNVDAHVGKPQVAYRETITPPVEKVEQRYVRQTGGRGQYGHVVIALEPTGPGGGYEFVDEIKGGVIPREYIPAVDAGIQEAMEGGVLAGYPLVDVRARLTYGSYHDVDSSEMAFKIAGSMAFKEAARKAKPAAARAGDGGRGRDARGVHGRRDRRPELPPRSGRGHGAARQRAGDQRARCRSREMFGYVTDLRSRTQGRATYTMQFDSYQQVPESIAQEIIARVRGE